MVEESPGGELGRKLLTRGGGVADSARGEDGFDVAGDDGRGEACSAGGLPGILDDSLADE